MMKWLREHANVAYWKDVAKEVTDDNRRLRDKLDSKEVYIKQLEIEIDVRCRQVGELRRTLATIRSIAISFPPDAPLKSEALEKYTKTYDDFEEEWKTAQQHKDIKGGSLTCPTIYGGYPAYIPGVSEWWRYTP
jgi:hypothetical protein